MSSIMTAVNINTLPVEMLVHCFELLETQELLIIGEVCPWWKAIVNTHFKKRKKNMRKLWGNCEWPARTGNLNILKWVRSLECEWDMDTCVFAAENGNLHIIDWAVKNGCPIDCYRVSHAAILNDNLSILKWQKKHKKFSFAMDLYSLAQQRGNKTIIAWLEKYMKYMTVVFDPY